MKSIAQILEELNLKSGLSLLEVLEAYNGVDLTEDEVLDAIVSAKKKKRAKIDAEELEERQNLNRRLLTGTQWSFKQTYDYMLYRAHTVPPFKGNFDVDQDNVAMFECLCAYFSKDPTFVVRAEALGVVEPNLEKGLFLAGNCGVGKTWMMQLFSKNQRQVFTMKNVKGIAEIFAKYGNSALDEFVFTQKNAVNDAGCFFHAHMGLCLDDIGTEDIRANYSNKKNVIGDILEERYDAKNYGVILHGTTNLTADQLEEYYGPRIRSRIREMMNFFGWAGEDRRK